MVSEESAGFVAKIISGGRITIPEEYRTFRDLKDGDTVSVKILPLTEIEKPDNRLEKKTILFNERLNQFNFMLDKLNDKHSELTKKYDELSMKGIKVKNIENLIYSDKEYINGTWDRFKAIAEEQMNLAIYRIARVALIADVTPEKPVFFKTQSNSLIEVLGVKFISGDGGGKYGFYRGSERIREFTKSKIANEDGITLGPDYILNYPDDVFGIRQLSGDGSLQMAILGMELKPPGAISSIEPYDSKTLIERIKKQEK